MKQKSIIVLSSTFLIMSILSFLFLNETEKNGTYHKQDLPSLEAQSSDDASKWIEARYFDQSTGKTITAEKLEQIRKQFRMSPRSKSISWKEIGPDNIGGRTRAIQIDRSNRNIVWAGGVSGGLFVSTNRGNQWSRVESYINSGASPLISSITQTPDGTLYVATGFNGAFSEPFQSGNGVWYSTNKGQTWSKIPGTGTCVEVESSDADNFVWLATDIGLRKWKLGDPTLSAISSVAGSCSALKVSKDGQLIVGAFTSSNRTYVSNDGGLTWTNKSGSGSGLVPQNADRIEFAISPTKSNGNYSVYTSRTGKNLLGMNVSHDNGNTWSQFIGSSGTPSNLDIYRDQGKWNSVISVSPQSNEKILIGGIDIWQWKQTVSSPPAGGFEQISFWFLPTFNPVYVHADNHEMKWDDLNRLYVGNDGGIGITNDFGKTWYPSNRGYNVTQFYGIAFDRDGFVMGGTQDNGTLYNDGTLSTKQEFKQVTGGDGFECEISFFNPNVMLSSQYNNKIFRSGDRGKSWTRYNIVLPSNYDKTGVWDGNYHPFHSEFVLAEYYDLKSKDSVKFIPRKSYTSGTKIKVPSMATGDSINYTTPVNLYFDDTLNHEPSLTNIDTSVVNKRNNQIVYLGNFNWKRIYSKNPLSTPPIIDDSLIVDFPTGKDTVIVKSIGTYKHYYAKNKFSGKKYSLGNDSIAYNIPWDTVMVQDPYQSWFLVYVNGATGLTNSADGGELWGTRNALRLSIPDTASFKSNVNNWVCIAKNIGGSRYASVDIEFSKDLNHCYVSAGNGVYRLDGLGDIYTSDPQFNTKAGFSPNGTPPTQIKKQLIETGKYEGLAVNPNDAKDVVLFPGFGGGKIKRSNNATSANPSFTQVPKELIGGVAAYDGIIDRDDPDILVVGTSEGICVSEDGGATWKNASTGFEGTPVYEVRQSWRTWEEGNQRPGEIYIGTFGRGMWSSTAYLGIENLSGNPNKEFKTKLKTFPNPTNDYTTLTFNLENNSTVNVYVYSISGALVKTISRKNMTAGSQTIAIDGTDLHQGTYIVKLIAGEQNDTVKFTKM